MALPAIPLAIGTTAGGILLGSFISTHVSALLNPLSYSLTKETWFQRPITLPEPAELLQLFRGGFLTGNQLSYFLKYHGINYVQGDVPLPIGAALTADVRAAWRMAIDAIETPVPLDQVLRTGWLTPEAHEWWTRQLKLHGFGKASQRTEIHNQRQVPSPGEILALRNRGKIDDAWYTRYMGANGITDPREQALYNNLRFEIPGPSDLIRFAVREVWDAAVVNRFDYDREFPAAFQTWMDRQGAGWRPSQAGYDTDPGSDITWPLAYWRSHWQTMGPGQAGEALHRLRPAAPGSDQSRIQGVPAFTANDYDMMMRIADYPPIVRQWFAGLSTQPLPLRSVQQLFNSGLIQPSEVTELFRDQAYSQANAEKMRDLVVARNWASLSAKGRAQMDKTARKGFLEGWMSEPTAALQLYRASIINPGEYARVSNLPQAAAEAEAMANPWVGVQIAAMRTQAQETLADLTIRAVKSSALRREITEVQARQLLAEAGIKPDSINEYVRQWNLMLMARGRNASAAQVLTWYKRGSITVSEAATRLMAHGYNARDANLMIGQASQDVSMQQQKTAEQLAKTQQQKLRAQAQQLKEADANRRRIVADLSRSASRAGILSFLKDGYISTAEAKKALMDRGTLPRDADLWIADTLKGTQNGKAIKDKANGTGQAASGGSASQAPPAGK